MAAKTATLAVMVAMRAVRRNGPVRSRPPQLRQGGWRDVFRPVGTEDRQGRGCALRSTETCDKCSQSCLRKSSAGRGRHFSLRCVRWDGFSGTRVEHIVDVLPFVQILDVLVPQMGDQLVAVLRFPSRLSQCPRSRRHPAVLACF